MDGKLNVSARTAALFQPSILLLMLFLAGISSAGPPVVSSGGSNLMSAEDPKLPAGFSRENESDSFRFSRDMLPESVRGLSNLQFGWLYGYGENHKKNNFTLDYMLPFNVRKGDVVYGYVTSRCENPFQIMRGNTAPALQVLLGGGYRYRLNRMAMLGVSGFINRVRFNTIWYKSAIIGGETAMALPGDSILAIKLNYFGNLSTTTTNALYTFTQGKGDYKLDFEYTNPQLTKLFNVKLRAGKYKLQRHIIADGWNSGIELGTKDGMFNIKWEVGKDDITQRYGIVGLYMNVGLRPEKLFALQNPFEKP